MPAPRNGLLAALLCLGVILAGCADATSGATATPTVTETETPVTTECTMRGGKHRWASPLDASGANVTATPFESLDRSARTKFREMLEGPVKEAYPLSPMPEYVAYNGTVYEIVEGNLWDECT